VADKEIKAVDLTFGTSKAAIATPAFFDEPQFTVAGVTQAANSGGHGSDTVLRTTEALARATAVLSQQSGTGGAQDPSDAEGSLRQAVIRDPTNFEANLRLGESLFNHDQYAEAAQFLSQASRLDPQASAPHRLIGDVEEKLGHPLEAERAYESAATLDPSEENLLDWGSELLVHRALEPATQVFSKGNHLFPKSVRMLVALGVAWYARGAYREAARCLENASDMAPRDPTPYLFLGKMQTVAAIPEPGSVERLARFVKLYPDKALANYYYAVGLWKQLKGGSQNGRIAAENFKLVDSLLRTAVRLDPQLGAAHLQLGIVYAERSDYQLAIPEFQKAVEVSAALDDTAQQAHYRLAQAYRRTGDHEHVKVELELQARSASQAREYAEQKRREIGEFVVALRTQPASAPTQP
jgi:tetratricopeptide (TPR) repeat protein